MEMDARSLHQPALDRRCLMSAIVVENKMNIKMLGDGLINCVEEFSKLDRAVTPMKLTNYFPGLRIERCKKRYGSVTSVVISPTLWLAGSHRQHWLRTVQGLDLRLLVNTQNQSLVRWIHIKANYVTNLLNKQRVFGQLKRLSAMRR